MPPSRDEKVILALLVFALLAGGVMLAYRHLAGATPVTASTILEPVPPGPPAPQVVPIYVHVAGAVSRPGVYRLAPDSRVFHALEAAGGATAGAVLAAVNLAARVTDGQRVVVPDRSEVASGGQPGKLDLNRAELHQLENLPGIGPALALAIIRHRDRVGRFASVDDLLEVSGIGERTLERIRPLVTVD